jgi:hypothetical protein
MPRAPNPPPDSPFSVRGPELSAVTPGYRAPEQTLRSRLGLRARESDIGCCGKVVPSLAYKWYRARGQVLGPIRREAALGRKLAAGYERIPPATPDEWGDLSEITNRATAEVLHRLDARERAAGHKPWDE